MKKIILIFSIIISNLVFSQEAKSIYKEHDTFINLKNTALSNGSFFIEKMKNKKGNHNYFSTEKFLKSDIVYMHQKYYDVYLKYDLHEDNVIIHLPDNKKNYTILLEKDLINSFNINSSNFIKTKKHGFLEEFFIDKEYSIYKKHSKKIDGEKFENGITYYTFKKKVDYVLYLNNTFYLATSKKNMVSTFPNLKTKINSLYKDEKKLKKNNPDEFFIKLAKLIKKENF